MAPTEKLSSLSADEISYTVIGMRYLLLLLFLVGCDEHQVKWIPERDADVLDSDGIYDADPERLIPIGYDGGPH